MTLNLRDLSISELRLCYQKSLEAAAPVEWLKLVAAELKRRGWEVPLV